MMSWLKWNRLEFDWAPIRSRNHVILCVAILRLKPLRSCALDPTTIVRTALYNAFESSALFVYRLWYRLGTVIGEVMLRLYVLNGWNDTVELMNKKFNGWTQTLFRDYWKLSDFEIFLLQTCSAFEMMPTQQFWCS